MSDIKTTIQAAITNQGSDPSHLAQLAADAIAQLNGWQPIETVPRNGARMMLAIEGVDRAVLAEWTGADWLTIDGHNWTGRKVTHWQPLPAPPEQEAT